MTESALKLESGVAVSNAAYAPVERKRYVDVFRGLLIAHMALDHATLMFNAWRNKFPKPISSIEIRCVRSRE